jgi:uncharacterized repeat protein (TIGR03803 family)
MRTAIVGALLGAVAVVSPAQTLTVVASFGADVGNPSALIQAFDGNFYGTTNAGGPDNAGTIFSVTPAGSLSTLANFTHSIGVEPTGLVQFTSGSFYGTARGGGGHQQGGYGTIFRFTNAGRLERLFAFNGTDGARPMDTLTVGEDGHLYGTAFFKGESNRGTIFRISPDGKLTTLYNFPPGGGSRPIAGLTQAPDGKFYGVTVYGGPRHNGTVFVMTPPGAVSTLHSFDGKDGADPVGSLAEAADGDFYGSTWHAGPTGNGTIFKVTPEGGLTTLYAFPIAGFAGALIQGTDGNLYGTTGGGGSIFSITPSGTFTTLHAFQGSEGFGPSALMQATDGNFYGATSNIVFRLSMGLGPFVKALPPAGKPGATVKILGTNLTGATSRHLTALRQHSRSSRQLRSQPPFRRARLPARSR